MNRPTLLLQLSVTPRQGAEASDHASGGVANVWVLADDLAHGVEIARQELAAAGWDISAHEEPARTVDSGSFAPNSLARKRYDQCQIDGVVVQLHTWRDTH